MGRHITEDGFRRWLDGQDDEGIATALLAPLADAIARDDWDGARAVLRAHVERAPVDLFVTRALVEDLIGGALLAGTGEPLLRAMRAADFGRRALPLLYAVESAVEGDGALAVVESECVAATELLRRRLGAAAPVAARSPGA